MENTLRNKCRAILACIVDGNVTWQNKTKQKKSGLAAENSLVFPHPKINQNFHKIHYFYS